jgi:predicted nucleic acid-binding protein
VTDFVLDASIALAWCFEDEVTAATQRVLARLGTEAASVPAIWPLEVANALTTAERRHRITRADTAEFIATLESLAISVDDATASLGFTRILDLAREQRLTAYDTAYLELAMRLGVPLASKDGPLCDAAERVGVAVVRAA